ncbi:putative DNA-binding protein [Actinacidiphila reveromycinica]|uniref:Putative DNA-binding protein n=1 Tax=Actinacidiphila reveromycinica TaxID=659352 RepID=A0A7U3UUU4_9ACTN|nr:helix-turn-helix transcriptional regulator [Streptomyces sp. SN-593]BBA99046.1 putative DNA-binding protein [Streptomyces sp. SN-593]
MTTDTTPVVDPVTTSADRLAAFRVAIASGQVSARALYAHHLAFLRAKAGLSLVELADRCHYEQSYLHRLETGGRLGNMLVAETLDRFYGTGELLAGLWLLAKREAKRAAGGLTALEETATSIRAYALTTVPALLQTPAYAEEQLATTHPQSPEVLAAQLNVLRERQARLTETTPHPVRYRAVLDELVLHRGARNQATWDGQLDHLIATAHEPAVTLQLLPLHSGPHDLRGPLQLLSFRVGTTLAYVHGTLTDQITDDPDDIEELSQQYDQVRDLALTPAQTIEHLHTLRTSTR